MHRKLVRWIHTDKMKKLGNKFFEVCDIENIEKAGIKAAKDKSQHRDVIWYKNNREELNKKLQEVLMNNEYFVSTEDYKVFIKQTVSGKALTLTTSVIQDLR